MNKVFTVTEVADILQVCDRTAYRLVHQAITRGDMFKVVKLGQIYRIPSKQFLDWIDNGCEGIKL